MAPLENMDSYAVQDKEKKQSMHEGHCDVSLTAYSGNSHTTDSHGESLPVVQEVSHGPKNGDSCDTIEAVKAILAEYSDGQFEFAIVRSSEGWWVFG